MVRDIRFLSFQLLAALAVLPTVSVSAPVTSGFDTSTEGWTPGPSTIVLQSPQDGNPGGYLAVQDSGNEQDMTIVAPPAFVGDLSSLDGGALSFDVRIISRVPNQPGYLGRFGTVYLSGPAGSAQRDLITTDPSETQWLTYSAPFKAADWGKTEAAWAALIADVDQMVIESESTIGDETVGFDNISLVCQAPPLSIASRFDIDDDGWMAGISTLVAHAPTGGNPGGYLEVTDQGAVQDMTIEAPAALLGDLRAFDGGTLSFDSRIISRVPNQPGFLPRFGTVWLFGSSGSAQLDLITDDPSEDNWLNYGAPLTAAAWGKSEAAWEALLADVTSIVIAAESTIGDEVIGYDNFSLSAPLLADGDCDTVLDVLDNCSGVANPLQRDTDGDNIGNRCDADLDQNCTVNFNDLAIMKAAFFGNDPDADLDGDGSVNFSDLGIMKETFFQVPGPSGLPTSCD